MQNVEPTGKPRSRVLLFKNLLNCSQKEGETTFSQAALYLASSLKKSGFEPVFSDSKISLDNGSFVTGTERLKDLLLRNPDINIICIPLCEDFFLKAKELVRFLRKVSSAFIGVGGTMPTLTPEHVFAHMPEINFLVRGSGEEALVEIAGILGGKNIASPLDTKTIKALSGLKGFLFRSSGFFLKAAPDTVNSIENLDQSVIDFSFLKKEDVSDGIILYTARGCLNKCFFCTTFGHGTFTGKSSKNLARICGDYLLRLSALFGDRIPRASYRISFYDDDFLADPQRALEFFDYLKNTPLKIKFFQTGIRSLASDSGKALIKKIDRALFDDECGHVYIGTENFCDNELKRLGKGYSFDQAQEVVASLSAKKIKQYHHLILTNHLTSPQEIAGNLYKIASLQNRYKPYFNILTPIIPYLVSLYPSISYQIAKKTRRLKYLNVSKVLSLKGSRRYDYPLVKNDIPINALTRCLVPIVERSFGSEADYARVLDNLLLGLSLLAKENPRHKKAVSCVIEKYIRYPELIKKDAGTPLKNHRNNIQLMITRRCHLRCRYCPIIKGDCDMDEKTALGAVDLLFTSFKQDLRLDFTGGEPLLRFDLVKKAVNYAKRLASRSGKRVSFYMVTNLISLTDEMADFLAAEKFFLELSLDGKERFHNLYKKSAEKCLNPYQATTRQLGKIFSRGIVHCAVMVVSPKTVSQLSGNFRHLTELGLKDIGLNYALGSIWTKPLREEFFRQLERLRRTSARDAARGSLRLSNLGTRSEPAVLNSEIMVDVDGQVHFLTDWLFERDRSSNIPAQGHVSAIKAFDEIYFSPAIILQRLLEYNNTSKRRRAIFNNIEMGIYTKQYFRSWKDTSGKQ